MASATLTVNFDDLVNLELDGIDTLVTKILNAHSTANKLGWSVDVELEDTDEDEPPDDE